MSFAEWELILSEEHLRNREDLERPQRQEPSMVSVQVISASPTKLLLAATVDDVDEKRADIELSFTAPIPPRMVPKAGDKINFEGTPQSYASKPFVMTIAHGVLLVGR